MVALDFNESFSNGPLKHLKVVDLISAGLGTETESLFLSKLSI